jgi:DNA primase catalytic subunit
MEIKMVNVFTGDTKDAKKGRKWLKNVLETDVVEVTFTKKDGSERIMKCTLKEDVLPEVQNKETKQKSQEAIAVWDVESEGWRSFRWDSIKSVKFSLGE